MDIYHRFSLSDTSGIYLRVSADTIGLDGLERRLAQNKENTAQNSELSPNKTAQINQNNEIKPVMPTKDQLQVPKTQTEADPKMREIELKAKLAAIPSGTKQRYQIHRLFRYGFVGIALGALISIEIDDIAPAALFCAIGVLLFFFTKRKYGERFIDAPHSENISITLENIFAAIVFFYFPAAYFICDIFDAGYSIRLFWGYLYLPILPIFGVAFLILLFKNLNQESYQDE